MPEKSELKPNIATLPEFFGKSYLRFMTIAITGI
jgi:hypothetical protein